MLRRVHFEEGAGGDGALRVVEHRRAEVGRPVRRQEEERGGDRGAEGGEARPECGKVRARQFLLVVGVVVGRRRVAALLPELERRRHARVQRLERRAERRRLFFAERRRRRLLALLEPLRRRADVVAVDVRHAVAVQLDRRVERRLERRGRGARARLHRLGQLLEPLPQPAQQHARRVEERLVERLDVGRLAQPLLQREQVAPRRAVVQQPRRVDPRELRHRRRAWLSHRRDHPPTDDGIEHEEQRVRKVGEAAAAVRRDARERGGGGVEDCHGVRANIGGGDVFSVGSVGAAKRSPRGPRVRKIRRVFARALASRRRSRLASSLSVASQFAHGCENFLWRASDSWRRPTRSPQARR